jgi:cellulose synthase/poly-beta-1,6-N-acetylglucosamine synthase-like glycosyltransferase
VAESYGAVVVETEQGGKAASQQVGLAYVTGDVLVCLDADTVIDRDVVEKFVAELEAGADATCANMLPMPQQMSHGPESLLSCLPAWPHVRSSCPSSA